MRLKQSHFFCKDKYMKKLLILSTLLFLPILLSAQDIQVSTGENIIRIQNSAPTMTLELVDDYNPVGLKPTDIERLLYNMNRVVDMMDYIEEEGLNVSYSSTIRTVYINSTSSLRFIFRIHLRESGGYKASISLVNQEQIVRYYLTRSEFEELMSAISLSYDRNEEVLHQISLLNQKVQELN